MRGWALPKKCCVLIAVAGLAGAACSPSPSSANRSPSASATPSPVDPASIDPCSLLRQEEAQSAVEEPVRPSVKQTASDQGSTECKYQTAANPVRYVSAQVYLRPSTRSEYNSLVSSELAKTKGTAQATNLTGVGDVAQWQGYGNTGLGGLYVLKGDVVVGIFIYRTGSNDTAMQAARTAALRALERF